MISISINSVGAFWNLVGSKGLPLLPSSTENTPSESCTPVQLSVDSLVPPVRSLQIEKTMSTVPSTEPTPGVFSSRRPWYVMTAGTSVAVRAASGWVAQNVNATTSISEMPAGQANRLSIVISALGWARGR